MYEGRNNEKALCGQIQNNYQNSAHIGKKNKKRFTGTEVDM